MGSITKTFGFLGETEKYRSRDGGISWRGPCPKCGGEDRFLMFTDMAYPDWNFQCSLCGYKGWVHQITGEESNNGYHGHSADIKRLKEEKERKAKENYKKFAKTGLWVRFHENLTVNGRWYWSERGISEENIDYWMLGEHDYLLNGTSHHTYTIPKWEGMQVKNIDYRFDEVPEEGGRYRSHPGLRPACMVCDKKPEQSSVLVVEGAIKAMVTFQELEREHQVIGVPSATSYPDIKRLVKPYDEITVILDPDAVEQARSLAEDLGGHYIDLPTKIDDGFVDYGMTKKAFENIYAYSRRRT